MPTPEESKAAGYFDVSEWGEKDVAGAYAPGTTHAVAGKSADLSKVPDIIGGKAGKGAKRPKKSPRKSR